MKVGLIDYGAGNLHSVEGGLRTIGIEARRVTAPAHLDGVDALVLPGVGACRDCVAQLRRLNLWEPLGQWLRADRPYLGICLGYQILFEESEEFGPIPCLGFLEGKVVRFPDSPDLKVPHMGWNQLRLRDPGDPLWEGLSSSPHVYFVHSYHPVPADPSMIIAETDYGGLFAAAVRRGNVLATQFHPEKSQQTGVRILRNYFRSLGAGLAATA